LLTTSEDQTTRIHAPVAHNQLLWHEVSRPQIHGHDLFAAKLVGNKIVSGAEEKILRAFQPTLVFTQNLKDICSIDYEDDDGNVRIIKPSSHGCDVICICDCTCDVINV